MKQRGFDFAEPPPMPAHCPTAKAGVPRLNSTVKPEDAPRLTRQCLRLLEMLRAGEEVTNLEMVAAGILGYTKRISELRKSGYDIVCLREDNKGQSWYVLREEPRP
jgi:hypothetical protein